MEDNKPMKLYNKLKEKNKFKKEFDDIYCDNWNGQLNENKNWKWVNTIQSIIVIVKLILVFSGISVLVLEGTNGILKVLVVFIVIIFLYVTYVYLNHKIKYDDMVFRTVEDTFEKLLLGYKQMSLSEKLSIVEVFKYKYSESIYVKIIKGVAYLCGILMEIEGLLFGLLISFYDLNETSIWRIIMWVLGMLVISGIQYYLFNVEAYTFGYYRVIAFKYRRILLSRYRF